ncbi:DUF2767 family protein [Citrobacter koseri]|nr:DUF2767 family protein [Citrobacter koseri]MBJ9280384.1 DUF2767 family protein [Citrobacter koseri]
MDYEEAAQLRYQEMCRIVGDADQIQVMELAVKLLEE